MPAHRKPPGSHADQRGYAARQAATVVLDAWGRTEPYPDPPSSFDDEDRGTWEGLWESAPASLWLTTDAPTVVELVRLRRLVADTLGRGEFPPGTAMSRLSTIEAGLFLSARARHQAGIRIEGSEFEDPDAPVAEPEYDW